MEKELREYAERLEEMVEERTRELRGAERMAAIGELASMVGHDLRNPLSGIAGATYFLKKKYDQMEDETSQKMFDIIERNIKYSNKIINDLLDYSRVMDLELSTTNPKRLVEEALESIVMPNNIRVVNLTLDEPNINIDIQMMKRVIINLVNNAIDAMTGGGEITIKSNVAEDEYELHITDTGVGIQDDILEKIWNPLFTTKAKGMGFGLSICKRILEYHRGSITVKSKVGEGTTFIIKFPLTR
jgi:signal transduction histidine kinase